MYVPQLRSVGRYECCSYSVVKGVKSGGGPLVPRHSYGGHTVKLWRASDWVKNDKKRLKFKQSRQARVYLGYIRPKSSTMRSGSTAGLAGYNFDLISERTYLFSAPDQVQLQLFLAVPIK